MENVIIAPVWEKKEPCEHYVLMQNKNNNDVDVCNHPLSSTFECTQDKCPRCTAW